jgi:hypothetical protein
VAIPPPSFVNKKAALAMMEFKPKNINNLVGVMREGGSRILSKPIKA